jgi:hypothetical protein
MRIRCDGAGCASSFGSPARCCRKAAQTSFCQIVNIPEHHTNALTLQLLLLLLLAALMFWLADVSMADLPLRRAMLQNECPIQFCNTGRNW